VDQSSNLQIGSRENPLLDVGVLSFLPRAEQQERVYQKTLSSDPRGFLLARFVNVGRQRRAAAHIEQRSKKETFAASAK